MRSNIVALNSDEARSFETGGLGRQRRHIDDNIGLADQFRQFVRDAHMIGGRRMAVEAVHISFPLKPWIKIAGRWFQLLLCASIIHLALLVLNGVLHLTNRRWRLWPHLNGHRSRPPTLPLFDHGGHNVFSSFRGYGDSDDVAIPCLRHSSRHQHARAGQCPRGGPNLGGVHATRFCK
jgi:hypothetical protein